MRSFDDIADDARDQVAFSNGAAWERWSWRWCQHCIHDTNDDCPLVTVAVLMEKTPAEWLPIGIHGYICTEFQPKEA